MRLFVLATLVVFSAVAAQAQDLSLTPKAWEVYTPNFASIEPRHSGGEDPAELRLAGGAWCVSKREASAVQFEWFPEVEMPDSISVVVLSTGKPVDENSASFEPADGIQITVGEGKLTTTVTYPDSGESETRTLRGAKFNFAPTDLQWMPIKIVTKDGFATVTLDDKEVAKISYDSTRMTGKRFGVGNKPTHILNGERKMPVSILRYFHTR